MGGSRIVKSGGGAAGALLWLLMRRLSPRRAALLMLGLLLAYLVMRQHHQQPRPAQSSDSSAHQHAFALAGTPQPGAARRPSVPHRTAPLRRGLPQDELLREGEYLVSPHDRFFLGLEDGVATARKGTPSDPSTGPPLWDTTHGPARPLRRGAHALVVQADGAVAVVSVGGSAGQSLVWSSPGASGMQATAATARYELRLEDDGGGSGSVAWSAAVYSVPTAADEVRSELSAPAVLVKRLFSVALEEPNSSELAQPAGASNSFVQASSPGRTCFRPGKRWECVRGEDTSLCVDVEKCVLRNLWDAQALCSLHSNCSGVARLPSSVSSADNTPHAHPKYSFVLCDDASVSSVDETAAAIEGDTWMTTSCDADSDYAELLTRINLVMTVKTSGKVHSTRVQ
eukprot:COSAG02_NODE_3027_length_7515_cov_16.251214_7_plen_399_part_00